MGFASYSTHHGTPLRSKTPTTCQGIVPHLEVISEATGRNEKQGKKRHHLTPAKANSLAKTSNSRIMQNRDGKGVIGNLLKVEIN